MQNMDILALCAYMQPPPVFAPGEAQFWTDPHIAGQMLAAHLDPDSDAASRRPETIRKCCEWLVKTLNLQPGDAVLDLGCGPGLYADILAQQHGLQVTGVDFSQNSIDYAEQIARRDGLAITYRCQDYLQLEDEACFNAALLIYGDYCPLSPQQRTLLLANVMRVLRPGGYFVLDVSTPHLRQREGLENRWYAVPSGFWKAGPHLVLEQGFAYPDRDIYLDQYLVIDEQGKLSVYRNWFQDFTAETICAELEANGVLIDSLWGDLTGQPYQPDTDWIGIIARKPEF